MPADTEYFQINFDAFEAALNPNVQVVLINTPNNPSGAVYSADTLKRLAAILTAKQVEYGHDIFLISDEPYREIVFDGATQPYPASFYANSLTCYSWSKSLSLPGERIGYVAVNPTATDADKFDKISLGDPLLTSDDDYKKVAAAIKENMASFDDGKTALCLMGHGTEADSNADYAKMQEVFKNEGLTQFFVGTVEAEPTCEDVIAARAPRGLRIPPGSHPYLPLPKRLLGMYAYPW